MELWIACDKSASAIYTFFLDYSPEVPIELLQSMILPFKSQMERISKVEQYIRSRKRKAKRNNPSIFRDFGHQDSFSVRYFNQSLEHQNLLHSIEDWASHEREEKCRELTQKKEQYRDLMQRYDQTECEYYEIIDNKFDGFYETRHRRGCNKCRWKREAASISIHINEWPLPDNEFKRKSAIFELMIPEGFREWRDATIFLLADVLECEYSNQDRPRARCSLHDYQSLASFARSPPDSQRIIVLSQVKPHIATHRQTKSIVDTTEDDVCLNNGLQYQYFDSSKEIFTSPFHMTDSVLELCTYQLPSRSSSLQKFLARPASRPSGPSPNAVIASQSDCPDHMSLDEFKAFGALPLGYRIQWLNVITQLSISSLDFTKVETNMLLLQTSYQVGPPSEGKGTVERASHEMLCDEEFGNVLLIQLESALQRLKENWKASRALSSFICVAARLISLASSLDIQKKCLKYLEKTREAAYGWVNLLLEKAQDSTDDVQRKQFLSRSVEISLICANTFDVDRNHLDSILASSFQSSIIIRCFITIREYAQSTAEQCDLLQYIMFERRKNLAYRALPILTREIVETSSPCLNDAIKQSWSDYEAGGRWERSESPYEHWLYGKTAPRNGLGPLSVHFNLLTAELLVNGLSLARLPPTYENHPTYNKLFGRSALKVMPAEVPGMEFSAEKPYSGYRVHFSMQSIGGISDLLVHATRDGRKYDFLPPWIFEGKFPAAFVNEFAHWYDHASNAIEFRPIEEPWSSSCANWWLTKVNFSWRLAKDDMALIGMLNNTALAIGTILSTLEERLNIHVVFQESLKSLNIELPRLQLGFYLEVGTSLIESLQFRGMSIAQHQRIGTLIGLRNKLVLREDNEGHDCLVIVPEGQVTYQRSSDHTIVSIDKNTTRKVHTYLVDEQLGRMLDNGNLQSKLFLCYLHGLTSYCLPDLLTQRTGTEQALSILNSAAVGSRSYYPANEQVMQTVGWDANLSFLSQHSSFYTSVRSIFERVSDMKLFYPDVSINLPELDFVIPHLLDRDLLRSSTFRVSGFGAEEHTIKHDVEYTQRDRGQSSERATHAFVAASMVLQKSPCLHGKAFSSCRDSIWKLLKACGTIKGPKLTIRDSSLKFDSKWLDDSPKLLGDLWCQLHSSVAYSIDKHKHFRIAMWLSTMAFAKSADMHVIHTLIAFFTVPDVRDISVPQVPSFHLSEGITINQLKLRDLIRSARRPFSSCPEAHLTKQTWESESKAQQRRKRLFQNNQDNAISGFASALELQWPCKVPQTPLGDTFSTYLDPDKAMGKFRLIFKTWFENDTFYNYLSQIETALNYQAVRPIHTPSYTFPVSEFTLQNRKGYITVDDIFATAAPPTLPKPPINPNEKIIETPVETKKNHRLDALLNSLEAQATKNFEKDYIKNLRESLVSLKGRAKNYSMNSDGYEIKQLLELYAVDCYHQVQDLYNALTKSIRRGIQKTYSIPASMIQWPRMSPVFLLQQLTYKRWKELTYAWKECIIKYGLALTELQRAERLVSLSGNSVDLIRELLNIGHQNWSPFEFPESLLLEVESGILIREVQEEIACQMRSPPYSANSVM
ncbi:hypothetical protein ACMFMG_012040 [Clarireedia jacksonii]